jgi:hypothetical protein
MADRLEIENRARFDRPMGNTMGTFFSSEPR